MKKIILLFALLVSAFVTAQEFPGKRPELLKGHEIKIKPLSEYILNRDKGYKNFYSTASPSSLDIYMARNSQQYTPVEALVNKTFTVADVVTYTNSYGRKYKILKLSGTDGKPAFYNYEDDDMFYFASVFEIIGGLQLPDDFYCDYIYSGKSPEMVTVKYESERLQGITFYKGIENNGIFACFEKGSDIATTKTKGLTIFLENNKTIEKPAAKVKTTKKTSFRYETIVPLTKSDLELIKNNRIIGFKVIDFTEELFPEYIPKVNGILNCLRDKE